MRTAAAAAEPAHRAIISSRSCHSLRISFIRKISDTHVWMWIHTDIVEHIHPHRSTHKTACSPNTATHRNDINFMQSNVNDMGYVFMRSDLVRSVMMFLCVCVCIFECKTSTVCINDCAYVGVNICLALVAMLPQYLEDEKTALLLQCALDTLCLNRCCCTAFFIGEVNNKKKWCSYR